MCVRRAALLGLFRCRPIFSSGVFSPKFIYSLPFHMVLIVTSVLLPLQNAQHFQASRYHVYKRTKRARKTHTFEYLYAYQVPGIC